MLEIFLVAVGLYLLYRWAVLWDGWMKSPALQPSSVAEDSDSALVL